MQIHACTSLILNFLANEFFIQFSQNIAPFSATKSQTEFGISRIHFIFEKKRDTTFCPWNKKTDFFFLKRALFQSEPYLYLCLLMKINQGSIKNLLS